MFRQVCTIEPSFFNATSGMDRRLFEGRHLVLTSDTIDIHAYFIEILSQKDLGYAWNVNRIRSQEKYSFVTSLVLKIVSGLYYEFI